jgi:hypothetical protein
MSKRLSMALLSVEWSCLSLPTNGEKPHCFRRFNASITITRWVNSRGIEGVNVFKVQQTFSLD